MQATVLGLCTCVLAAWSAMLPGECLGAVTQLVSVDRETGNATGSSRVPSISGDGLSPSPRVPQGSSQATPMASSTFSCETGKRDLPLGSADCVTLRIRHAQVLTDETIG
jgi:hypothetical protein